MIEIIFYNVLILVIIYKQNNCSETFSMKYTFCVFCIVIFLNVSSSNAKIKHFKAFNEMRIGLEVIKITIKNNAGLEKVWTLFIDFIVLSMIYFLC